MANSTCTHELVKLEEADLANLRKQARRERPPMAWIDDVHRCNRCNGLQATISWFGQVYHAPVEEDAPGNFTVRWPTRADAPGANMGMG